MLVRSMPAAAIATLLSVPLLASLIPAQNPNISECSGVVLWAVKPAPPAGPPAGAAAAGCKIPLPDVTGINPKNNGLAYAFVWFEPAEKGAKFAIPPALAKPAKNNLDIDQPNCEFEPHAFVREGQTLTVKNSSKMAHNFKLTGLVNQVNPLIPPGGQFVIKNLVAEKLPDILECNIHPWMRGAVKVFDHPYYAVTDEDGKFTMPSPPAGACVLKIWHESKGWLGAAGRKGQPIAVTGQSQKLGEYKY